MRAPGEFDPRVERIRRPGASAGSPTARARAATPARCGRAGSRAPARARRSARRPRAAGASPQPASASARSAASARPASERGAATRAPGRKVAPDAATMPAGAAAGDAGARAARGAEAAWSARRSCEGGLHGPIGRFRGARPYARAARAGGARHRRARARLHDVRRARRDGVPVLACRVRSSKGRSCCISSRPRSPTDARSRPTSSPRPCRSSRRSGATVVGVSGDDIDTLSKFSVQACQSRFPVASDPTQAVMKSFDAVMRTRPEYANRVSYVIAPDGASRLPLHEPQPDPARREDAGRAQGAVRAAK